MFKEALRLRLERLKLLEETAEFTVLGSDFVKLPSYEYALMRGREFIEHCAVKGFCGQAFTDKPQECRMKMAEIVKLNLDDATNRALFFSALNAVMSYCGEIGGAIHCIREEAEKCGEMMAEEILKNHGKIRVVHIGYQPGHVKALSKVFSELYVTDMNAENIGKTKFGVKILDASMNKEIISKADLVLITGSSLINGTLFKLLEWCEKFNVKCMLYGITAMGAAKLLKLKIFRPFAHETLPKHV
jgi:uncharacterized protein (DUF4213/DUF364 family)